MPFEHLTMFICEERGLGVQEGFASFLPRVERLKGVYETNVERHGVDQYPF